MRVFFWVLAVFGAIVLLLFAAIIGFGAVSAGKIAELSKGAASYADETIGAYGAAWDEQILLDRAAPELINELARNPGAIENLSRTMDFQAGAFVSADPSACGKFSYTATTANGEVFTAECVSSSLVAKGAATFSVSVVWCAKAWRLLGFFVNVDTSDAPDRAATVVSYIKEMDVDPVGLTAAVGARSIAFSPKERSITFASGQSRPAVVGVHAHAETAPPLE